MTVRLDAAVRSYLDGLRLVRSADTLRTLSSGLPRFVRYMRRRHVSDARAVTIEHLARYAHHLAAASYKPASQRSQLSMVRGLFAALERDGRILRSPATDLPLPRATRLPRALLSETEALLLMATPDPRSATGQRDRALLELLYGSGLRASECRRVELTDLDLAALSLLVRDGKGRKDRIVPLTARAAAALALYLSDGRPRLAKAAGEPAVLLSRDGRPLSRTQLQARVVRHARAAGIEARVSPHALRHACATHLLRGGADVRHVQEILGHKSITTTALYTRVTVEDLARVVTRCHPRERRYTRERQR